MEPVRATVAGIQNSCAARGLGVSGAVVKQLLTTFQTETELRLDLIERVLREYRLSCSPLLIIQHNDTLATFLQNLVSQQCQYIRFECERVITPVLKVLSTQ